MAEDELNQHWHKQLDIGRKQIA